MSIPAEDKATEQRFENVEVDKLTEYFNDLEEVKDLCDDYIECFKKEHRIPPESDKYELLMELEAELIVRLNDITEQIRHNYVEIFNAYEERALERVKRQRLELLREESKKPKMSKEVN
ncbi:hypothetical protein EDI_114360 [Entamoeba dispar SAW760]|uniref:Uncharacterized protein n=1 Tax=Entamoeba dispar (strain ATCC PRA-260 / SAW760) TaxID=370354 RepID=B0ELV4_ENTDS|nr:uncharacterized protein EDI_114360 [Entamoeba dispar SAW760]EDR24497.1 hypothetical protein EDI_114360 [Entamoeba dispar SAW760]|eukprot:EDR24497.1 hypothetical protein EDI_114360 [Entamoeba dispar SAW760]